MQTSHDIYQASVNAIESDVAEIRTLNQQLLRIAGGPGGFMSRR
jgi:hypothetical protein